MLVNVNNIDLYYKKTGSGDPLILLHGNSEDSNIFNKITVKLKDYFTVYAIDSRNHGKSGKSKDYKYEYMASDLKAFIEELELDKPNILGFSDGAILSLMLSISDGNLINKQALLGPSLTPEDLTDDGRRIIEKFIQRYNTDILRMILTDPHIELAELKKITVPTLIVGAENDIIKPEVFKNMVETISNSQFLLVKGHSHETYIVDNDMLFEELLKFFKG
ncbi:MAG: alpha/beta hydrolase [Deltaproteobacteria bacterium]|jgi:pimeloyl-ACP methyl ester carboxylesterase|nr:alpha/beta hydrolase [Deltaproteobacteria bacterium]